MTLWQYLILLGVLWGVINKVCLLIEETTPKGKTSETVLAGLFATGLIAGGLVLLAVEIAA